MCLSSNGVTFKRHLFKHGRCKRCETMRLPHTRKPDNRKARRKAMNASQESNSNM